GATSCGDRRVSAARPDAGASPGAPGPVRKGQEPYRLAGVDQLQQLGQSAIRDGTDDGNVARRHDAQHILRPARGPTTHVSNSPTADGASCRLTQSAPAALSAAMGQYRARGP